MKFVDDPTVERQLFPMTLTRPIADIRIGIMTIREKWLLATAAQTGLSVPSNLLPSKETIAMLQSGDDIFSAPTSTFIRFPWNIFQFNDKAIREDYQLLTAGRISRPIPPGNKVISPENVFLEEDAKLEHCIINASAGPVYLGKNSEIMEGSMIRGPFALCEGAIVKMGAKIYGATTVGPYSLAGGEIKNSVIFGYSNKAHDGYLGDSIIGEWCNLGAGTCTSNLKNSAAEIKVKTMDGYSIAVGMKCGLIMGDYSRCAINTSFNTGTVAGVCCNIFGEGLTPGFIPNFSWGLKDSSRYKFDKAIEDIKNWKRLKERSLTEIEVKNLKYIYDNY